MDSQLNLIFNRKVAFLCGAALLAVVFTLQYSFAYIGYGKPFVDPNIGYIMSVIPVLYLIFGYLFTRFASSLFLPVRVPVAFTLFCGHFLLFGGFFVKFMLNDLPMLEISSYRVNTLISVSFVFYSVYFAATQRFFLVLFFMLVLSIWIGVTGSGRIQFLYFTAGLVLLGASSGLFRSQRFFLVLGLCAVVFVVASLVLSSERQNLPLLAVLEDIWSRIQTITLGRIGQIEILDGLIRLDRYTSGETAWGLATCLLDSSLCWGVDIGQSIGVVDRANYNQTGIGPGVFGTFYLWFKDWSVIVFPLVFLSLLLLMFRLRIASVVCVAFFPILAHVTEDYFNAWSSIVVWYISISVVVTFIWRVALILGIMKYELSFNQIDAS